MKAFFSRLAMFLTHGDGWRVLIRELGLFLAVCLLVSITLLGVSQCTNSNRFSDREAMRDQ